MANAKKKSIPKEDLGEPTFDKQLEDYAANSTESDDPIFSGRFFNFMDALLTKRDAAFKVAMIKEVKLLMLDYNSQVKSTISELLTTQTKTVGNVVGEVMVGIETLDKKLNNVEITNRSEHTEIMTALADLKIRQDNADDKLKREEVELKILKARADEHEKRLNFKKKRMDSFEKDVSKREKQILEKIKSIDDLIHGEVPVKVFKTYNLEKWILAFILAVLVSTLITFYSIRKHAKQVIDSGHNGNIKIENTR